MAECCSVGVVITAAGNSTRMGGMIKKEFLPLKSGTVLSESVRAFFSAAAESSSSLLNSAEEFRIGTVVITVSGENEAAARESLQSLPAEMLSHVVFAVGGSTRQRSVYNGLRMMSLYPADVYLIHDGARPFVSPALVSRVVSGAKKHGACAPGLTAVDTESLVDSTGLITNHIDRALVRRLQTPQGFYGQKIFTIAEKAVVDGKQYTDDTSIWHEYGVPVYVCAGEPENIKITFPSDLPNTNDVDAMHCGAATQECV